MTTPHLCGTCPAKDSLLSVCGALSSCPYQRLTPRGLPCSGFAQPRLHTSTTALKASWFPRRWFSKDKTLISILSPQHWLPRGCAQETFVE